MVGFIFLALTATHVAQQKKFKVDISVSSKTDEKEIESYAARELRSLGDVEVTELGDFTLIIIVIKSTSVSGSRVFGYDVSYSFLENIVCDYKLFSDYITGGLQVTDTDGLRKSIESIVTSFDTSVLDKRRKVLSTSPKPPR